MINIRITLPGIPRSLNAFAGRRNIWEYREEKQHWTDLVCLLGRSQRPTKPLDKAVVTISYRFPDKRRRDPDNYNGKMLLDGLTQAGIIADDSFQHIKLILTAEAPGPARTTIFVKEML